MIDWEKVDNTTEEELALQKLEDDLLAAFDAFLNEVNKSNAELLAALEAITDAGKIAGVFSDAPLAGEIESELYHEARAAIAKARGL